LIETINQHRFAPPEASANWLDRGASQSGRSKSGPTRNPSRFWRIRAVSFAKYPSLKGRVVFITGGGSGIGAAMVEAFTAQGASVAFVDILEAESRVLAEGLGKRGAPPLFLPCDLMDTAALRAAIAEVGKRIGPIGVLINNAANDTRQDVDDVSEADWDRAMGLNLNHQFFAAQAVRPHMREIGGGSIVNFSSIAWMAGGARMTAYATAKAGIIGLTNSLAREFGPDNIRVNAIAPGAVITERQRRLWISESDLKNIVARQCLNRVLLADEIARAALFLASADSAMISKQCMIVDGGLR
jgi:NAD(P)-dependent dehydrogenase (short-subunit alcohol dehydrogenase family)